MCHRQRIVRCFNRLPRYFFFLLGLLALSLYLFVPLIYYLHLTPSPLSAAPKFSQAGHAAVSSQSGPIPAPHNRGSCPICLAADTCQDYSCSAPLPVVPDDARIGAIPLADCRLAASLSNLSVSPPRAPPRALHL